MTDVVLTTLNARYAHSSLGLRYLLANLGDLQAQATILEFDIQQRPIDVLEAILSHRPRIVAIGVYIWNADAALRLAALLKHLRPDITLILGGPEVSHETQQQEIARYADYIITGEADLAFTRLCRTVLSGDRPAQRIIAADPPPMDQVALPYDLYNQQDIDHRVIYVEASRGCPFRCEFCLSSLDVPVRAVPLDRFLPAMQRLLDRGVRQFKFVDRTFNLDLTVTATILEFFRQRYMPGLFLHFEMIPDRFPGEQLRHLIAAFPPGSLQFEVGVQTFNPDAAALISRRQDSAQVEQNLLWLRGNTSVHLHADLIVGLPGEDLASFAAGFDRLLALGPQEIQVGMLKRLHGAPICRHDESWAMVYSPQAPYEVLQTRLIDFPTMQRLRRFARYWELLGNSGRFRHALPLLWGAGPADGSGRSPFAALMDFSDWLFSRVGRTHAIALPRLTALLATYLIDVAERPQDIVAGAMARDARAAAESGPRRQDRHAAPNPMRTINQGR